MSAGVEIRNCERVGVLSQSESVYMRESAREMEIERVRDKERERETLKGSDSEVKRV